MGKRQDLKLCLAPARLKLPSTSISHFLSAQEGQHPLPKTHGDYVAFPNGQGPGTWPMLTKHWPHSENYKLTDELWSSLK